MIDMIALEQAIIRAKKKYNSVFSTVIEDDVFIWRLLTQKEYEIIDKTTNGDIYAKEEMVCQYATVYPNDIVFALYKAGVPTQLSESILYESGFKTNAKIYNQLEKSRTDINKNFMSQAYVIICSAFPQYKIEEVEEWDIEHLVDMVAKAEWKMNVIDGKPFTFEKTEQAQEEINIREIEEEIIKIGGDPILLLYNQYYKRNKEYCNFPFIVGRSYDNKAVCDGARKEIQQRYN